MPTQGLLFPAADFVRTKIQTSLEEYDQNERTAKLPVVIDCRNIQKLDYTAAMVSFYFINKLGQIFVYLIRPLLLSYWNDF